MDTIKKLSYFKDKGNSLFSKLHYLNGYLYATNGYIVVRAKCEKTEKLSCSLTSTHIDRINELFDKETLSSSAYTKEWVESALGPFKTEEIYNKVLADCNACYGGGTVDYEFSYDNELFEATHDCPVCNGTGKSEQDGFEVVGKCFPKDIHVSFIEGKTFPPSQIMDIFTLGSLVEIQNIKEQAIRGVVSGFEFIIMSYNHVSEGTQIIELHI